MAGLQTEDPKPRSRMWMRVLLGVSLALNLLVIGLVVGTMLRFGGPDGARQPPRSVGLAMVRALPGEERRALLGKIRGEQRAQRGQREAETRLVLEALRADPFDRQALDQVLERQAEDRRDLQLEIQRAWLDRVARMDAGTRFEYADRIEGIMTQPRRKPRE